MSAVGPAGTESDVPHVAGVPGDSDAENGLLLPAGERCYQCDVGVEGIPLERPLKRRQRRRANDTRHLPVGGVLEFVEIFLD